MMNKTCDSNARDLGRHFAYRLLGLAIFAWIVYFFIPPGQGASAPLGAGITFTLLGGLVWYRNRPMSNRRPLINPIWARPLAAVAWVFALIGLGQWLTGGVEYIGDIKMVASAPGTAAIVLATVGIALWLFSSRRRDLSTNDD